ncbi:GntR family transcriptional regulator [Rossellomorea aquimaris]|uniref:GntR family transcriptional regulator n=1 Tax=Rossellomorea aquimaris TaxID=189382 RepID=UPI001CD3A10D|nr:GntR family transcriptional regulator [Rossellomorea aquimaris]MCA1056078.1 GntR family transcriptional regulator [Rossellomorea aquimaris]
MKLIEWVMNVKKKDTAEYKVYRQLKDALLARRIAPGTQLVEKTISESMYVSRTPIRQALKRLEQEGLVQNIPNRGAFVVHPTKDEITSFFEMRKELEFLAVKYGLPKVRKSDIAKLHTFLEMELETYEQKDLPAYVELNKQFHLFLAEVSGNKFLIRYMDEMLTQSNVYLFLFDVFYHVEPGENVRFREHEEMVKAIENHDHKTLLELIDLHMKHSFDDLRLDDHGYSSLEDVLVD